MTGDPGMAVPAVATASDAPASRGARIVLPGQSPDGAYVLSVLVKRTFDIVPGGACTPAASTKTLR